MTESCPPIVSIIGQSGAGKTTFLTKLVAELKARHHRVAVLKHHSHPGVEIDRPGKDTWRHFQAGADAVVLATPDRIAIFGRLPRDLTPEEAASLIPTPVDLVLTEGYKRAGKPAIEVVRAAQGQKLIGEPGQLIALVTDLTFELDLPHFQLDDAAGVADFLERRFSLRPASGDTRPPEAH
jgi:molybdopterin-guanine dinucleotide biosynthesis protein B